MTHIVNPTAQVFRFAALEFDPRALELRKDGVKVKLEGQPLRILALLIERTGEVVTRKDLRKQLWPGKTIVDFEHSINAAMKRLREALGDSAERSHFIETLPRRGYRFLQPVRAAVQAPAESYEFDARGVTPEERPRLAASRRADPESYEAYLLGRAFFSQSGVTAPLKAKDYFHKAITKDPTYAPAYASLAEVYAGQQWALGPSARLHARQWAEKALALDDGLAQAHAALARVAMQEWDWRAAERGYRRAIELNPSYAVARVWYAMYLYATERFDEAVVQARRAQQLDPVSSAVNTWAGRAFLLGGHVHEAAATWRLVLELDPTYSHASLLLAGSYAMRGVFDQAIAVIKKGLTYTPKDARLLGALAHAYGRLGHREEALSLTGELVRTEASGEVLAPFALIWAYAGLENYDETFARLQKASDERLERVAFLNVDERLAALRSDPRFQALVRRMNMPMQAAASAR